MCASKNGPRPTAKLVCAMACASAARRSHFAVRIICTPVFSELQRLQEGIWANMVSNVREGDKAQIRHQATRSAVGCSRPRWNCRSVALVSSCKPFLSTQQLPRHNATLKHPCSQSSVQCDHLSIAPSTAHSVQEESKQS